MTFMFTYTLRPGTVPEAASRFLSGKGTPPESIKMLGRWHKVDGSGGYVLLETDDLPKLFEFSAFWSDVLEMHGSPIIEDADAGAGLAAVYGK